ncbi:hypothetical protein C8Q79DRAFT_323416 [Trametes meyenii]|nr:hypothetical protein C8Q79DRAFT_323416 [Trametes meyenii]
MSLVQRQGAYAPIAGTAPAYLAGRAGPTRVTSHRRPANRPRTQVRHAVPCPTYEAAAQAPLVYEASPHPVHERTLPTLLATFTPGCRMTRVPLRTPCGPKPLRRRAFDTQSPARRPVQAQTDEL